MKKSILFTLLVLPLMVLSGCDLEIESSGDKFNDSLTFEKQIYNKTPIINLVVNATKKYSSVVETMKVREDGVYDIDAKAEYTAYENTFTRTTVTGKQIAYESGITLETKIDYDAAMLYDGEQSILSYSDFDTPSYSVYTYDESSLNNAIENMYEDAIGGILNTLDSCVLYSNAKETEYTFVRSNINENYNPVAYGNGTFVEHTIEKEQIIIKLNKDYSIKTVTNYLSIDSNVNPATNEHYDEIKTLGEEYVGYTLSYGKRKTDEKLKQKYFNMFKDKPMFTTSPVVKFYLAKGEDSNYTMYDANYYTGSEARTRLDINSYKVMGSINLNIGNVADANGFMGNVSANVKDNYKEEYSDLEDINLSFNNLESDIESSVKTYEDGAVILTEETYVTLYYEFVLTRTLTGFELSNEKYVLF